MITVITTETAKRSTDAATNQVQNEYIWARWTEQDNGDIIVYISYTGLERNADENLKIGIKLTGPHAHIDDLESFIQQIAYNDDKEGDDYDPRDLLDAQATAENTKNTVRTVRAGGRR